MELSLILSNVKTLNISKNQEGGHRLKTLAAYEKKTIKI